MRDLIADIDAWRAAGGAVAIASVVQTWGSAPRQAGGAMAIGEGGRLAGSVSGGCVEAAVIKAAAAVLEGGPPHLLPFEVADGDAMSVGLPCGGRLRVYVERLDDDPATEAWLGALRSRRPAARVVGLAGDVLGRGAVWAAGDVAVNVQGRGVVGLARILRSTLVQGGGRVVDVGGHEFFACAYPAPDRLVIVGAVHIAQPLSRMAREIGYRTVLVDPRAALATAERFPAVDDLRVEWPAAAFDSLALDGATDVVVLSHDDKIDDPAIVTALMSPARYVGALGSRKRTAARAERLLAAGFKPSEVDRLDAPIGLDIGARTPEEIAVSILARLVEVRANDRTRRPLS